MEGKRRAIGHFLGLALAAAAMTAAPAATSQSHVAAGTLNLRGTLRVASTPVSCPELLRDATECRARSGEGPISGLGTVSEAFVWAFRMGPPTCPSDLVGKPLATTGRLIVVGKGEIHFALRDGARCIDQDPIRNEPQDFAITGGTGSYAGASGSGTVARSISAGAGSETWNATLDVTGLEFDVTPPTVSGATSKTVRAPKGAKRLRVTYAVSASDAVDGAVPVSCAPRSGSRFSIGRTLVLCSAADSSANTRTARFTVTVKRRR